jgi:hypothetical protein
MGHCHNCLLPEEVPGSAIDSSKVCWFCRSHAVADHAAEETLRRKREADLEHTLRTCKGQGEYDVLVNLSGGKDSCYLLYKVVKEYGLKALAFTTDMHVPDTAWENIRRTVKALSVDHTVYTPPKSLYRKLFRFLLQNQEARGAVRTVCYVCAPMFEGYSLKTAVEKRIPLVLAGYSPGQPEPERMEYEFGRALLTQQDWTPPEVRDSGLFNEDELSYFWNPARYPHGTAFPRYLAPFHAWPYNQSEVMERVVKLGLARSRHSANPVHSNCPVNWLLMYSDLKHLGYNPYTPEFARLIREGKASRAQWRILLPIVNFMLRHKMFLGRNVRESLAWLGLREEELRITRLAPAGSAGAPFSGARMAQNTRHAGAAKEAATS